MPKADHRTNPKDTLPDLILGTPQGLAEEHLHLATTVRCDDTLQPYVSAPFFQDWIQETYGITYRTAAPPGPPDAEAPERLNAEEASRHLLICGATGFGKSYFIRSLVRQTVQQPGSTLVIDPKGHLIEQLLLDLAAQGFPPERLVLLDPSAPDLFPSWNPLEINDPAQTAHLIGEVVTLFKRSMETWGPRMSDILTNALFCLAERGLTMYELRPFLTDEDYRERILAERPQQPLLDPLTAAEVHDFWTHEFAHFSSGERAGAVNPVLNKIRDLVRHPYLRRLICARESTLDFAEILDGDQVLLVNLNSTELGEEATRLLASLLIAKIYRTAAARSYQGHAPCNLVIDELALFTTFAGDSVREILETARGFGLRLVLACQHLAQMSAKTLTSVLANTYTQVYFNLGEEDARAVTPGLLTGVGERLHFLELAPAEPVRFVTRRQPLRSRRGGPLKLHRQGLLRWLVQRGWMDQAEAALAGRELVLPKSVLPALAQATQVPDFQVRARSGEVLPATTYLGRAEARLLLTPPGPGVEVVFPEARIVRKEKWTETALQRAAVHLLTHLDRRETLVRRKGTEPLLLRTLEVRDPEMPPETVTALVQQSLARVGRPQEQVDAELRARREAIRGGRGTEARPAAPSSASRRKKKKPAAPETEEPHGTEIPPLPAGEDDSLR